MVYGRTIISGTLPLGEVWSTGFCVGAFGAPIPTDTVSLQLAAEAIRQNIDNLVSTNLVLTYLSTAVTFNNVRCTAHDSDTEAVINYADAPWPTPKTGFSIPTKGHSTALVVSLKTAQVGARGRGRMFWPTLALPLDSTCVLPPTARTNFITSFRDLMLQWTTSWGLAAADSQIIVRSTTGHVQNAVVSVAVGSVPDVQRRRRDNLVESYTTVGYNP